MDHKNFDFTQIPDKTNVIIFLKSPKIMLLGHFWPFLPNGDFFQKNPAATCNYIWPLIFQKNLTRQSQENLQADGRMDRQSLLYRTLPAETRDPTTSLQQVTGGNTPAIALKRMLR